jgi:hypothetical protein
MRYRQKQPYLIWMITLVMVLCLMVSSKGRLFLWAATHDWERHPPADWVTTDEQKHDFELVNRQGPKYD